MNYIVFPGNVGDNDALLKVAITLGVPKKISVPQTTGKDSIDGSNPSATNRPEEGADKQLPISAVVPPLSFKYKNDNKLLSEIGRASCRERV